MNILQLCDNYEQITNLSYILKENRYYIINKFDLENISFVSYDAFIITVDFIEKNNQDIILEICSLDRPVIFVYNSNNLPEDFGMRKLQETYKVNFALSDCSILDTNGWNYKPVNNDNDTTYIMTSKVGEKYCFVKNTNKFLIFKHNNIVIMHDVHINHFNGNINLFGMYEMMKKLFEVGERNFTEIKWFNSINILNDNKLIENKENIEKKIENLKQELTIIEESILANNEYKKILYTSGDELVDIVEKVLLEMLNISIDDIDRKKQDLYFKLNDINILVEIKGVNHPFKRENIGQAKRHVTDYANKNKIYGEDVNKLCKGVLIINPYSLHDLKDKISKDFYSKEVIEDAKYENICTLDTLTLLNYYSKWKKDSQTINLKDIILKNTYNKPDYDEIINL